MQHADQADLEPIERDLPAFGSAEIKGAHVHPWPFIPFELWGCVAVSHLLIYLSVWKGGSQGTTFEDWFSLSTTQVPGILLKFSSLATVQLYPWLSHWPLGF